MTDTTDAIVKWSEVQAGDLVLLDDCLITAERVDSCQKPWGDGTTFTAADIFHRLDNGYLVSSERHGDRYTAVRRTATANPRILAADGRWHGMTAVDPLTDVPMVCTLCRKPVIRETDIKPAAWRHADLLQAGRCVHAHGRIAVKAMVAAGNENVPRATEEA